MRPGAFLANARSGGSPNLIGPYTHVADNYYSRQPWVSGHNCGLVRVSSDIHLAEFLGNNAAFNSRAQD